MDAGFVENWALHGAMIIPLRDWEPCDFAASEEGMAEMARLAPSERWQRVLKARYDALAFVSEGTTFRVTRDEWMDAKRHGTLSFVTPIGCFLSFRKSDVPEKWKRWLNPLPWVPCFGPGIEKFGSCALPLPADLFPLSNDVTPGSSPDWVVRKAYEIGRFADEAALGRFLKEEGISGAAAELASVAFKAGAAA